MKRVIDKKAYNTETAIRIATDDFSDGTNEYNCGRTSDLYRTQKGSYFIVRLTCWQGERDSLEPVEVGEAIGIYEGMFEQVEKFEEAFPGVEVEEA